MTTSEHNTGGRSSPAARPRGERAQCLCGPEAGRHVGAARSAAAAIALLLCTTAAHALDLWKDEAGERRVRLDTRLKWSALGSRAPHDAALYADRWLGAASLRARFEAKADLGKAARIGVAYEQIGRWLSTRSISGVAGRAPPAAYRLTPLAWSIQSCERGVWLHDFDRLWAALYPKWGEVTIGRQAVGLGRAWLLSAVDVFAPFSPSEFDRDWRPGVDAARISYRLSDTSSAELLGVLGRSWRESALLGRVRGYAGEIDWELIAGKRAEDCMWAGVLSGTLGEAEGHLELATFLTPDAHPDGGPLGCDRLMMKATAGISYTFSVGNGLTVLGEYHYSSFGVADISDATALLADPDYAVRFSRGDAQILGRHGLAFQMSYPFDDMLNGSLTFLVSPADGSGLAMIGATWDLTDETRLSVVAHLPWGASPTAGRLRSEYGATPISVFVQLSVTF